DQVAVRRIVPRRPGVAAIVRAEIGYAGPPARSAEGGLDLPPAAVFRRIGAARRRAENGPRAMGHLAEPANDAAMEPGAAVLAVLRVGQHDVRADEIDVAPVEIECLRHPSAGPQQKQDQWSKVA